MIVWVVGKAKSEDGTAWELQGIYSEEATAIANCTGNDWFVGPVPLDVPLPEETEIWPESWYPNREPRP